MALKKSGEETEMTAKVSTVGKKAEELFSQKERKVLTTFSIEPSFKRQLEDLFKDMGLGWAAGIRFSLKEFYKKHSGEV